MKEQKKHTTPQVEKLLGMEFTLDESLDKYTAPEYKPEKLKEIEKNFSKKIVTHQ